LNPVLLNSRNTSAGLLYSKFQVFLELVLSFKSQTIKKFKNKFLLFKLSQMNVYLVKNFIH
jgi:hypothetical protein